MGWPHFAQGATSVVIFLETAGHYGASPKDTSPKHSILFAGTRFSPNCVVNASSLLGFPTSLGLSPTLSPGVVLKAELA
jgi:hypothetical protein